MSSMAINVIVLGCVVVLFIWNRLPVEIVAGSAALVFYATGVLRLPESLAGFGDAARPLLMTVTVAAASVLTPVAAPVNRTVSEARGDRFGDYWRLGLPPLLIVVGVFLVPIFWRF